MTVFRNDTLGGAVTKIQTEVSPGSRRFEAGSGKAIDADSTSPLRLRADDLCRRNPSSEGWLLRGASLEIDPGDRLAIIGPSGAGKTVLLRAIAVLDPVDKGTICFRGRVIAGEAIPWYRSKVVYLHQRPALLDGSVENNLKHPYSLKVHRTRRFDRKRIVGLLAGLGRDASFLDKSSRDLSGGESQIVALLRALQLDPVVLLLDEPTASLDAITVQAVEHLVARWFEERPGERSSVWVSHNHKQARRVADRLCFMREGTLEPEGPR
jgi:putative ABC transport system ATP-binding protein